MKRLIAICIALVLILTLIPLASSSQGHVFVAAGNTVLPLTKSYPINSGGLWYIDYQCFAEGALGVSCSYNSSEATLVLYNWDTTLIFDINKQTAYTAKEKTTYKQWAFVRNGTVYVPVEFTAQTLGLEYYYFPELPLIRIKKSDSIPNNMFFYIAKARIPDLVDAYNLNNAPQGTQSGNTQGAGSSEDADSTETKPIYLTFNIENSKNFDAILSRLSQYGIKATFFIKGSLLPECGNELRRAVVLGHSVGTLSENGASDFSATEDALKENILLANEKMFKVSKIKTKLVRSPSEEELSDSKQKLLEDMGYRIWTSGGKASGSSSSAIYNSVVRQLGKKSNSAFITLDDSDITLSALRRICDYLTSNKYSFRIITILDNPF